MLLLLIGEKKFTSSNDPESIQKLVLTARSAKLELEFPIIYPILSHFTPKTLLQFSDGFTFKQDVYVKTINTKGANDILKLISNDNNNKSEQKHGYFVNV